MLTQTVRLTFFKLSSADKSKFEKFGTTWAQVNVDRILIFG